MGYIYKISWVRSLTWRPNSRFLTKSILKFANVWAQRRAFVDSKNIHNGWSWLFNPWCPEHSQYITKGVRLQFNQCQTQEQFGGDRLALWDLKTMRWRELGDVILSTCVLCRRQSHQLLIPTQLWPPISEMEILFQRVEVASRMCMQQCRQWDHQISSFVVYS